MRPLIRKLWRSAGMCRAPVVVAALAEAERVVVEREAAEREAVAQERRRGLDLVHQRVTLRQRTSRLDRQLLMDCPSAAPASAARLRSAVRALLRAPRVLFPTASR